MGSFSFFPLAFSILWDQQKVEGSKAEQKNNNNKKSFACGFSTAWAHSRDPSVGRGARVPLLRASQNCQKMWIFELFSKQRQKAEKQK